VCGTVGLLVRQGIVGHRQLIESLACGFVLRRVVGRSFQRTGAVLFPNVSTRSTGDELHSIGDGMVTLEMIRDMHNSTYHGVRSGTT
jgi:hypothetical protein